MASCGMVGDCGRVFLGGRGLLRSSQKVGRARSCVRGVFFHRGSDDSGARRPDGEHRRAGIE